MVILVGQVALIAAWFGAPGWRQTSRPSPGNAFYYLIILGCPPIHPCQVLI